MCSCPSEGGGLSVLRDLSVNIAFCLHVFGRAAVFAILAYFARKWPFFFGRVFRIAHRSGSRTRLRKRFRIADFFRSC